MSQILYQCHLKLLYEILNDHSRPQKNIDCSRHHWINLIKEGVSRKTTHKRLLEIRRELSDIRLVRKQQRLG
jgi:hypothetical protein